MKNDLMDRYAKVSIAILKREKTRSWDKSTMIGMSIERIERMVRLWEQGFISDTDAILEVLNETYHILTYTQD